MFYLWQRNKNVALENLDGHLRIRTQVNETFFSASVVVLLRLSDLTIVSVAADMPRPINEECPHALPLLQQVVGLRVAEGLTKRVDDMIGRRGGCTHMANLVLEACHAAAVGFRQIKMAEAVNAGSTTDDFYREFMETRPKELLNSCVAFHENSPLLRRLANPTAQRRPSNVTVATRLIAGVGLPMVRFGRDKLIGVGRLDQDTFLARGVLEDNAHSMQIEVEMSRPDFTILAVRGQMVRVPNDICRQAVAVLPQAVGLGLRPGLTAAVDERIGRAGCPHLANLLLEACHGVIQGTLGAAFADFDGQTSVLSLDEVRGRWLQGMPLLRESCLAYHSDSSTWQRLCIALPASS